MRCNQEEYVKSAQPHQSTTVSAEELHGTSDSTANCHAVATEHSGVYLHDAFTYKRRSSLAALLHANLICVPLLHVINN
jgi:hypothetical protein